jgi:hypothetical protein
VPDQVVPDGTRAKGRKLSAQKKVVTGPTAVGLGRRRGILKFVSTEQEALDAFFAEFKPGERVSTLEAAIRDARWARKHWEKEKTSGLWLVSLGYLIVLEILGNAVARSATLFPNRKSQSDRFIAGALEFSSDPSQRSVGDTLWRLRCALSHEYALISRSYSFGYRRTGEMIKDAITPWDRTSAGAKEFDQTTWINLLAVWDYVETLVSNAREEHTHGNVVIAPHIVGVDEFDTAVGFSVIGGQ